MTTCTCLLSETEAIALPTVLHYDGCALLVELDRRIAGDILPIGDVLNPEVGVVRRYGSDDPGRVYIPGCWDGHL